MFGPTLIPLGSSAAAAVSIFMTVIINIADYHYAPWKRDKQAARLCQANNPMNNSDWYLDGLEQKQVIQLAEAARVRLD